MEVVLDIEGIMKALPHRYPFLLLDRVIEWERGERLVAIKNVTMNEPFFQGHFPGNPVMPGVLILEAMAQGAAILMKNEDDVDVVPLFMGIDKARFRRQVVPGDQLRLEVETLQKRRNVCKGAGKAFVGEELAAEAELMAMLVPRDQL
jgi:beta-hydroxyacyl-ACP dehydratase FabZ